MIIPQDLLPQWKATNEGTVFLDDKSRDVFVLPYSAFGQSGDDYASITDAYSILPKDADGYTQGRVRLGPFPYLGYSQANKPVCAHLAGTGGTILKAMNAAATLYTHDPIGPPSGYGSYQKNAGRISDLIIDGSNAGANAIGLDIGDGYGHETSHVRIQNFGGTGAIGAYFVNRYFWTEKCRFDMDLIYNTIGGIADIQGGAASFEFSRFDLKVFALALQNGFQWLNGAYINKGRFAMGGNMLTSATPASGLWAALAFGAVQGGGFYSQIKHCELWLQFENDLGLANAPQTINYGSTNNLIQDCGGGIAFTNAGTWTVSNLTPGANQLQLAGEVYGDSVLNANNGAPAGFPNSATPLKGSLYRNPADPAGTASTTRVMMGLGQAAAPTVYTPIGTGRVRVTCYGYVTTAGAAANITVGPRWGTGAAPANGDPETGTAFGGQPTIQTPGAGIRELVSFNVILGLTANTTYWFDWSMSTASAADTATITVNNWTFEELAQ
jgi:hypothetical protein